MAKISQYEKRKAKASADLIKEVEERLEEIKKAPEFTQKALDIYTPDGGRTHKVAEIAFNPETGEAKVIGTYDVTRIIALRHEQQKVALNTLKQKKKEG